MPRRGRTSAATGSSFSLAAGEQGLRRRRRRRRGSSGVDLEAWRPSLPLRLPPAAATSRSLRRARFLSLDTTSTAASSRLARGFLCPLLSLIISSLAAQKKNNSFHFFEIFSFKNFVVTCFLPLLSPLLLLLLLLTPGLLCESERERRARSNPGAVNF